MKIKDLKIRVVDVPAPGSLDKSPVKPNNSSDLLQQEFDDTQKNKKITTQIVVVTAVSETGLEGHGFGWGTKGGMRLGYTIAEVFRPEIIGVDVDFREQLWQTAHKVDRLGGLASFNSYGPVDVALWDLAAKAANKPLYKFIGAYRNKIRAYASSPFLSSPEEYVELANKAKSEGFTAFKLHPPGEPDLDIECCRAVRQSVGKDMELMIDPVGGAYDHSDALKVGRALESLDFLWFEEPLFDHDIHGLQMLTSKLDIPIVAGEWDSDFFSKVVYLKTNACDVMRADVSWTGGVTGTLKTAHLAESFGMNCELHMTVLSLMDIANLHVGLSKKNCRYIELPYPDGATFGITNPIKPNKEGYIEAPTMPGLGAVLNNAEIEENTVIEL